MLKSTMSLTMLCQHYCNYCNSLARGKASSAVACGSYSTQESPRARLALLTRCVKAMCVPASINITPMHQRVLGNLRDLAALHLLPRTCAG